MISLSGPGVCECVCVCFNEQTHANNAPLASPLCHVSNDCHEATAAARIKNVKITQQQKNLTHILLLCVCVIHKPSTFHTPSGLQMWTFKLNIKILTHNI